MLCSGFRIAFFLTVVTLFYLSIVCFLSHLFKSEAQWHGPEKCSTLSSQWSIKGNFEASNSEWEYFLQSHRDLFSSLMPENFHVVTRDVGWDTGSSCWCTERCPVSLAHLTLDNCGFPPALLTVLWTSLCLCSSSTKWAVALRLLLGSCQGAPQRQPDHLRNVNVMGAVAGQAWLQPPPHLPSLVLLQSERVYLAGGLHEYWLWRDQGRQAVFWAKSSDLHGFGMAPAASQVLTAPSFPVPLESGCWPQWAGPFPTGAPTPL